MATFPSEVAQALPLPNGVLHVGIWPADPLGAMRGTIDRLKVDGGLVGMADDVKPTASVVGTGGCTCSPASYHCLMLFCLVQPAQVDDQHFENGEDMVDSVLECQWIIKVVVGSLFNIEYSSVYNTFLAICIQWIHY
ncbi:hypothetical protein EDD16DRAFT_1520240 [Pisolithus croceorrhizus]|nr:hypothetical protein EDD16DRAFT_1520240 [Pisolithus croceorrhizus]